MDLNQINKDIIDKIESLNTRKYPLSLYSEVIDSIGDNDLISKRLRQTKRHYRLHLILNVLIGGFLFLAGLAQVFEIDFVNLTNVGLLIVLAISSFVNMVRLRIDIERLSMIMYLIELRAKLKE